MAENDLMDFVYLLDGLIIYRNIKTDPVLHKLKEIVNNIIDNARAEETLEAHSQYCDLLAILIENAEKNGLSGNIYKKYIIGRILNDENIYSNMCDRVGGAPKSISSINEYALRDMDALLFLMNFNINLISRHLGKNDVTIMNYSAVRAEDKAGFIEQVGLVTNPEELMSLLKEYYSNYGSGEIGTSPILRFDGENLYGVKDITEIVEIINAHEKGQLIENTKIFLDGWPAESVLLIGENGMGKTSMIYSLGHEFFHRGLRILDINANDLAQLPKIMRQIQGYDKKFILFVDDLHPRDFQKNYVYFKDVLEMTRRGSDSNVLLYASTESQDIESPGVFGLVVELGELSLTQFIQLASKMVKNAGLELSDDFISMYATSWVAEKESYSVKDTRRFVDGILREIHRA